MQVDPAQPHAQGFHELERQCRRLSAIAELSRMAISARDARDLLPRAQSLVRATLGRDADLGAVLAGVPVADIGSFAADETEFLSAIIDVLRRVSTARDRERLALAAAEGRFVHIFRHSPVALATFQIDDGRVVDVNERWLSMLGYTRAEVIGKTNHELGLSADFNRRAEVVQEARTKRIVRDQEMQLRTKSGAIIDIIASAVPLTDSSGEEFWMSAIVEITDRKRAAADREQLLAREQIARAEAEQALEKLDAVYAMTEGVWAEGPPGELLGGVLRRLRRTLQVDHASVFVLDDDGKALQLRAIEGPEPGGVVPNLRMPINVGVSGRIAAAGKPIIVSDYSTIDSSTFQSAMPEIARVASVMGAPFRIAQRVAGVVVVSTRERRDFTEDDLRLLTFAADRVGPAIDRGRLIDRIRNGMQRQRALARRLLTAQEEERRRVAVELHDELGQVLTAVKINLESLELPADPRTQIRLAMTIDSVDGAMQRVKDIALDLRPSVLDDLGLEAALRWFTDRCTRNAGIAAHLSIDSLPALEPNLQTACFRVTQEALTNVERHARARHVWIDVHVLDGALELSVRDDGIGFDVPAARARANAGGSVGLLGMQERVALMGGEYEIVQVPAGGTEVRARFPLTASGPQL